MRYEAWNPNRMDATFEKVSMRRLEIAADAVAHEIRFRVPVGTVSHLPYKTGKYPGVYWTERSAGMLKRSIRIVRKKTKVRKALSKKRNVRVYIGHKKAYYARIVEYYTPFVRPGYLAALPRVKSILGVK